MKILGFNITRANADKRERQERMTSEVNSGFSNPTYDAGGANLFKPSSLQNVMMDGSLTPISCVLSEKGKRLMGQAREVATSSPFINAFMTTLCANVIGAAGFTDSIESERVKKKWLEWCELVDIEEEHDLSKFIEFMLRSWIVDGDGIAVAYSTKDGLRLKWIDPAILDHDYNRPIKNGENPIVNGVEIDLNGKKLRYHFQNLRGLQPWEFYSVTARDNAKQIRAENVLHLYTKQFPSQVRGITALAPAMGLIAHMNRYMQSEVTAKHFSASKFAMLSQRSTGDMVEDFATSQPDSDTTELSISKIRYENLSNVESGAIDVLPQNFDLLSWDAKHDQQVDAFMRQLLQIIGKGLGMSYSTFTGDLSQVNFSSIRAGSIEERQVFAAIQKFIIQRFLNPLFKMWCEHEGIIYMNNKPNFTGRKWSYVNPQQEIEAAAKEVELGVRSKADIIRARGENPEIVFAEIEEEQASEPEPKQTEPTLIEGQQDDEPTETDTTETEQQQETPTT